MKSLFVLASLILGVLSVQGATTGSPSFESIVQSCAHFTSTSENEVLCVQLRSSPAQTESCFQNSSTAELEAECLEHKVTSGQAASCRKNTSTAENESLCNRWKVPAASARVCFQYSSTPDSEAECLMSAGHRPKPSPVPNPAPGSPYCPECLDRSRVQN